MDPLPERVTLTASPGVPEETPRLFVVAKLPWVRRERARLRAVERGEPRAFLGRESHRAWGRRSLLELRRAEAKPRVKLRGPRTLRLTLRPGAGAAETAAVVAAWRRGLVRAAAMPIVAELEPRMGVRVEQLLVQRMRTRWGSCTRTEERSGRIRLHTELSAAPPRCLRYLVTHELAHLLVRSHGPAFTALLDRFQPAWREDRGLLSRPSPGA